MNEFKLIEQWTRALPTNASVIVGPGDDCAVLNSGLPGKYLLLKTDAVVQGVHFSGEADPEKIGHKAMGRPLSDIAAMAGQPTAALVTIALPTGFDPGFIERVYTGMRELAQKFNVAIVGGETTATSGPLLISVCILGEVAADKCILRSGSKPGDALFVTGELGGSLAGRHLEFEPRLAEAQWLASRFPIHAMIDLSDGLAGDLRHLLRQDELGAEILAGAIPISRAAKAQARAESSSKTPLLAALSDGEDFELLFTVPPKTAVPLLDAWKQQFPGVRLSCIGKMTAGGGLKLRDKTGLHTLQAHGYVHFT
jgi:thiamine-monophosphate kinase